MGWEPYCELVCDFVVGERKNFEVDWPRIMTSLLLHTHPPTPIALMVNSRIVGGS